MPKSPLRELIKRLLKPTGYTITRLDVKVNPQHLNHVTAQQFLDLYFSRISKDFFFVQIGANDGQTEDLLHPYILKYNLSGLLVEPQKDIFEKLKQTYAGRDNLIFVNTAIASERGSLPFYKVRGSLINETNAYQASAISSLNKETLRGRIARRVPRYFPRISENLDDYIEEITINTMTFEDLVRQYEIKKIDFLFIDCEGYDYEILKMVDFKRFSPSLINYESNHLNDEERAACEAMLHKEDYQTFRTVNDTCAFK